jgi:peptidylprolyl isomerase
MKTLTFAFSLLAFTAVPLFAQTASHLPVHNSAAQAALPASECVTVPELSPNIPAVPAGTACPKSLFTITLRPAAMLDYVSPIVSPDVRKSLGLDPHTFTLAYQDLTPGSGELALPNKIYTVDYTGYLVDGTKFDSSIGNPEHFSFPIGAHKVIAGWDLGLQGLHIGGKRRIFVPYELAYGEGPHGPIPPKSELIFDIELISQKDVPPPPPQPAPPAPPSQPAVPPPSSPKQ